MIRVGRPWLVLLVAALCFVQAALAAPSTQPVAPPYEPSRSLLGTKSARTVLHDDARDRDIPIKAYYPSAGDGTFPVIVFSHGLGGSREGYEYLGRQWSANGYVVIHTQHPGSDDKVWRGNSNPMEAMRTAANGVNAIARPRDVSFVLDQLDKIEELTELKGKLDKTRIGVSGHSFGAQTTLLLAGQQLGGAAAQRAIGKLSDERVKAVIPMSAPVPRDKASLDAAFADVRVPVFIMTGTLDDSPINDTKAADRRLPFDHMTSSPAFLLILTGGDHMVFSGRSRGVVRQADNAHQQIIRAGSTAFWDAYLKDDARARKWLDDGEFEQWLANQATLEQK